MSVEEISINDMDIGIPELQTVLYKSERLSQFFYSKASSLHETKNGERKLFRSIQHIHAQLHEGTLDQEIYLEKTSTETLFGWNSLGEFELYIVLSTFLSKERLIAAANRVVRWIRREESNLLVIGSPTW